MNCKKYYHASQTAGLTVLKPKVSNHGKPLVYFSEKRENVLVYLSNAVEKFCRETGFIYNGIWQKWASYGFDEDGKLRIDEYYPNALADAYKGVSGFIYCAENVENSGEKIEIPYAISSAVPVEVTGCEFVADAYDAIMQAEKDKLIKILRYEDLTEKHFEWIRKTIMKEYENAENHPEYRYFLTNKFDFLKGKNNEL